MSKLTNNKAIVLFRALSQLGVDPKEKPEQVAAPKYKFSAVAIYNLAYDYKKLADLVALLESSRVTCFKKYAKEGQENLEGDAAKQFMEEYTALLNSDADINLKTVNVKELKLEENAIPFDILASLLDDVVVGEIT